MRALITFGLLGLLLIAGCGYKQGIAISDQAAYLYFTGNTSSILISVDDGEKFSVKAGRDHQYQVTPGKHIVRVYRGNAVIVERQVYLADGVAKEIGVN